MECEARRVENEGSMAVEDGYEGGVYRDSMTVKYIYEDKKYA